MNLKDSLMQVLDGTPSPLTDGEKQALFGELIAKPIADLAIAVSVIVPAWDAVFSRTKAEVLADIITKHDADPTKLLAGDDGLAIHLECVKKDYTSFGIYGTLTAIGGEVEVGLSIIECPGIHS